MRIVKMVPIVFSLLSIVFSQTERWVYRYNGSGNGDGVANSIIYGADGNIYAAGGNSGSILTVSSLTTTGGERWVYQKNDGIANSFVFGTDGNIYVAASFLDDFTVISVTPNDGERWVYRYNRSTFLSGAYSIVYGADGNIYAAGMSQDTFTQEDFTVISITSSGTQRWVYRYSAAWDWDYAKAIVYGADGNIYAAGFSNDGWDDDFTVISLTKYGSQRWIYRYNGPGDWQDRAYSVVYGADGNIYVAGNSDGGSSINDLTVISLTTTGSERWVYRYNGSGNYPDEAFSLVYGFDGNIYAAGYSCSYSSQDLTVISLTTTGSERWVYRFNPSENRGGQVNSIVYGIDNNIYTAGWSYNINDTTSDFIVISLDTLANERWVYRYNGSGFYNFANSVTYGTDSNIYAAGRCINSDTNYDFVVISLTAGSGIEENNSLKMNNKFDFSLGTFQNQNLAYTLSLFEPADVSLSLYNLQGQKVESWKVNSPEKTSHYVKNLPNLNPGVYFLKAEVLGKGYKANKKLIIIK